MDKEYSKMKTMGASQLYHLPEGMMTIENLQKGDYWRRYWSTFGRTMTNIEYEMFLLNCLTNY